jgi:hypothetical protein
LRGAQVTLLEYLGQVDAIVIRRDGGTTHLATTRESLRDRL